jgi:hypothetical protein
MFACPLQVLDPLLQRLPPTVVYPYIRMKPLAGHDALMHVECLLAVASGEP